MPAIHLVRHGQASFGAADYDELSELGERQAQVAAEELQRRGVRSPIFVSGSLKRQRATALILAARCGVDSPAPAVDARWNEFDAHDLVEERLGGPGSAVGITSAAFQVELDPALHAWMTGSDTGWEEFRSGVWAALRDIAAQVPKGSDAVVATSAGITAIVCGQILGLDPAGIIALNRVSINASITTILAGARGLSLLSFNDHAHLIGTTGLITNR
jgi:broad specificity phosphatase PhoE